MKITTAAEMREIDRVTSERFGVPSLTLMENAGSAIADFILQNHTHANRVTVLCGKGNNGGDGFVVARKLHRAGRVVEVLLLGFAHRVERRRADHVRAPAAASHRGDQPARVGAESERSLANCDLLVDAILGTGFRPPVTGLYAEAIAVMNRQRQAGHRGRYSVRRRLRLHDRRRKPTELLAPTPSLPSPRRVRRMSSAISPAGQSWLLPSVRRRRPSFRP